MDYRTFNVNPYVSTEHENTHRVVSLAVYSGFAAGNNNNNQKNKTSDNKQTKQNKLLSFECPTRYISRLM